jgi:hypothetical protein
MKTNKILAIVAVAVAATTSGCTGLEVGGKAWITRVDERQESQRTHRENVVPLKCYFVDCSQDDPASQEVKGS